MAMLLNRISPFYTRCVKGDHGDNLSLWDYLYFVKKHVKFRIYNWVLRLKGDLYG
jgi:hypothetical protein